MNVAKVRQVSCRKQVKRAGPFSFPAKEKAVNGGYYTGYQNRLRQQCGGIRTRCSRLRTRPLGFLGHYVRRHPVGHAVVLASVLLAVGCGVGTQYGMKHLIDVIAGGPAAAGTRVWWAFALLAGLIAADNLLWRIAGFTVARVLSRSPATSAATCSPSSPAIRRRTSPSVCLARWPAASAPPPPPPSPRRAVARGMCCHRRSRW